MSVLRSSKLDLNEDNTAETMNPLELLREFDNN